MLSEPADLQPSSCYHFQWSLIDGTDYHYFHSNFCSLCEMSSLVADLATFSPELSVSRTTRTNHCRRPIDSGFAISALYFSFSDFLLFKVSCPFVDGASTLC